MASPDRLDATALACVGVALVTWSSAYAAIAYALAAFTPGEVALARLAIAALCFALLLAVRRVPLPSRREWPALALLGVIGFSIYHLCLNLAETRIASGTASILIALVPAATAAVAATWMGERLPARTLAGLAVDAPGAPLVAAAEPAVLLEQQLRRRLQLGRLDQAGHRHHLRVREGLRERAHPAGIDRDVVVRYD